MSDEDEGGGKLHSEGGASVAKWLECGKKCDGEGNTILKTWFNQSYFYKIIIGGREVAGVRGVKDFRLV